MKAIARKMIDTISHFWYLFIKNHYITLFVRGDININECLRVEQSCLSLSAQLTNAKTATFIS